MAANFGVDSYNFLRSSLSKQNVLVVGDGNFSFSLSLAIFRDELGLNSRLVLTSFDSRDVLKLDEFARVNLERLQGYEDVDILHNIDATKLSQYFQGQKFGRIIFNFPHTGGKSNIRRCRKLLEDFFNSAVEHVESYNGDICVTLCKGQGGTPEDEPQRGYGNSWQIVNNAAKAGFILHQLHPFLDSDYAHYSSVGYRGKLARSFHTSGGLIHIFIPGVKLDSIEDLSEKTADIILSHVRKQIYNIKSSAWRFASDSPLCLAKKIILDVLSNMAATSGTTFEEILYYNVDAEAASDDRMKVTDTYNCNNSILSAMKKSHSFVLTGVALTIPEEITSDSNIVMRYLAISKLYDSEDENNLQEKTESAQQQEIIDKLKKMFSSEHEDYVNEVDSEITVSATDSTKRTWTNSSEVAHLARNKFRLKRKADAEKNTATSQEKCTCQTLCSSYLSNDARIGSAQRMPMELFDQSTVRVFKTLSAVVIVCGRLKQDVLKLTGHRRGWLILINLDVLAMVQHNLSDIRLLSSGQVKWKQRSTVTQEESGEYEKSTFIPVPMSLFPPEHVHDISFWISGHVSQELFFFTTIALTKNCVKEIKLTEIYHDEDKHWLSFNYRMIYSRVDGPLSHLDAVELQNRLRRALIVLGFGLK